MPSRDAFDLESLKGALPKIFDQAQNTTANHQKNYVALYKLQVDAATYTESVQNGKSAKLTGEREFQECIIDMLSRTLPVKKGNSVADRIIKFVGGYTKFVTGKVPEERQKEELDEDDDTTSTRLTARVLRFLLRGCVAKDKAVRYRVLQCISDMICSLGELDEDMYVDLRTALMERTQDRESTVRMQAVNALAKLVPSEDISELDDDEPSILDVLCDTLAHDTSAEVRRAALLNIRPTRETLPVLLARSRDVDASIRKAVYLNVLDANCLLESGSGVGFTHPRILTIAQRELIVRNGLGDREDSVKAAAGKLMGTWVDAMRAEGVKNEDNPEKDILADLVAFLRLFDLNEGTIGQDALSIVLGTRPEISANLEFPDEYWASLTPEKAFLARVFVDHCLSVKDENRLESALPVVTALAFRIQDSYNELVKRVQEEAEMEFLTAGMERTPEEEEEHAKKEEERMDREFVLGEMLKLAVNLDYADEIGRRKMFQLVRDMLSHEVLPEGLLERCLDVLRILSPNERDLIRVVVEVVHELRDLSEPEPEIREPEFGETPATVKTMRALPKPIAEMTVEEKERADTIDLRCLSLCIGMLERVNGTFEENSTLEGILGELIIPTVKRKELALRQKGLVCLGLCCLIARKMAMSSFKLFVKQLSEPTAPEVLKISLLHILFDILMVHDSVFLGAASPDAEQIQQFLLFLLERDSSDKVQATLCMGISKLMLSGIIADERFLRTLAIVFISPETAENQELRQCLSYFLPVYCYSSAINQRRMQKIFVFLFEHWRTVYKQWDGEQALVSPAQLAAILVDWTDPQKAAAVAKGMRESTADDALHVDLAVDIIKALFNQKMDKDDKKALCQLLSKLYIPDTVDDDKIRTLQLLIHNLNARRPLQDTTSRNAFTRFEKALAKRFEKQLADFNEDEYRQLEYLKELFEFLDEIIPDDDDEEVVIPKKSKKRRSNSVGTESTISRAMSDDDDAPRAVRGKGKSKAKRRRVSGSSDESENERRTASPPAPRRAVPKRSAAAKSQKATAQVVDLTLDSDDDEDDDDDDRVTPTVPHQRHTNYAVKRESDVAEKISGIFEGREQSFDSIMDSSDDDDASEVEAIL
ncbi:hypothetical protein CERSUDRAFT_154154 [Gelatoporia subvermispora B]|uniref:Nuclear condensin complex subunit 3 C-terminal domain-containing protein n=1 Tax=Ceriporiopsis subvermispora (strain B) TaxID=914234 RepID=M2RFB8_CERS8|nr:hypothetical protein CERSUDRAFT_154154 [Gelatoporia subvermispora B]